MLQKTEVGYVMLCQYMTHWHEVKDSSGFLSRVQVVGTVLWGSGMPLRKVSKQMSGIF